MTAIFTAEQIDVVSAASAGAGLERAVAERPEVIVLDLRLPDASGLDLLPQLAARVPGVPVVLLTAHADVKTAVRATQLGAFDYLTKPIDGDELVLVVRRALEHRALQAEVEALREQVQDGTNLAVTMGPGPEVRRLIEQVRTVAPSDFTVLLLGETGTGKELVARAVHDRSERRKHPFIAVDCGAIPETLLESELFGHEKGAFTGADRRQEGRFQLAEGGTFFLDEIGNLPASLQAKLLRVLESKQVQSVGAPRPTPLDVRFVAATNVDLEQRVAAREFRADLYFRLAQYTIRLPALRERASDVEHLARRFMTAASIELRRPVRDLEPEALELLRQHGWPGNVRELLNVIRQAVLTCTDTVIRADALRAIVGGRAAPGLAVPPAEAGGGTLKEIAERAAREAERRAICEALRASQGNKAQAARALSTDYKTLHVKIKTLGIDADDFAG